MKSIIAEDLVKTYDKGTVRALDHLSLDVEEGTVLGVLGPNGAGKTTTVRILATLLNPDSGRATVGGIDVVKHPEKVREIQKFAQFENFSNWEKLTLAPTTVKQDRSSKVQEDFLAKTGKTHADFEFKAVK